MEKQGHIAQDSGPQGPPQAAGAAGEAGSAENSLCQQRRKLLSRYKIACLFQLQDI